MTLPEMICKELGVEVDISWLSNSEFGYEYKITSDGELVWWNMHEQKWKSAGNMMYVRLLRGELKPIWKPMYGYRYYVPHPLIKKKYDWHTWDDREANVDHFERGLVFKTKEEAIECAERMLEVVKGA